MYERFTTLGTHDQYHLFMGLFFVHIDYIEKTL